MTGDHDPTPIPPIEIGDLAFTPRGDVLRVELVDGRFTTTLSVTGAQMVMQYLEAWIQALEPCQASQAESREEPA